MGKFALIKFSLYKSEKVKKANRRGRPFCVTKLFYKTILQNYFTKLFYNNITLITRPGKSNDSDDLGKDIISKKG